VASCWGQEVVGLSTIILCLWASCEIHLHVPVTSSTVWYMHCQLYNVCLRAMEQHHPVFLSVFYLFHSINYIPPVVISLHAAGVHYVLV